MGNEKREMNRRELYELVWKEPLSKLAPMLKLLPRELATVCDEHEIPRPASGYWSQLANNKAAASTPLPRPDEGSMAVVFPDYERKLGTNTVSSAHFVTDADLKELIRFEERSENKIVVSDKRQRNSHVVVASTKKSLSTCTDNYGRLCTPPRSETPVFNVVVFKESSTRAVKIIDAIVRAVVDRGFVVEVDSSGQHIPYKVWFLSLIHI